MMIPTTNYKKIAAFITCSTIIISILMILSNYDLRALHKNYAWVNILGVLAINLLYYGLFEEYASLKYWRFQLLLGLSSIGLSILISQMYFKLIA